MENKTSKHKPGSRIKLIQPPLRGQLYKEGNYESNRFENHYRKSKR